ncbi:UNVERIFIED_CONTAM: hypothetical protein Slati_3951400 [Sesamum latifolium]|uniref:Reverse transcriptase domain-containing protein n=1 Tax=Sesamum latifolium TaxID=2727402 RepID=A0AAW2TN73_9LAMI
MDTVYFTRRFGFHAIVSNATNKIWCFSKIDCEVQVIQDHDQFLHVKVSSGILPEDIFCTFIYAKCSRNPRRILWEELKALSNHKTPWLVGGDFNAILHTKRTWENKQTFGNIFSLVDQAKSAASEAEILFDKNPCDQHLISPNQKNAELVHALNMESEYWRQKNNCKWLEAGERNTKYFHSLVKKKRSKALIHRIMEDHQEITNPNQIKASAAKFFENLLTEHTAVHQVTNFPFQFPQVSEEVCQQLFSTPSLEEVKEVVFSINKDSVAGPDGFSSSFYQNWEFIATDVWEAVRDFFCGTPMPRSFTATSITLIPKLAQALPHLISPSQSGFVPGRLISDNILLAQEMIHQLDLRHNRGNLVIKLDMLKAYDRINWRFLCSVLAAMGFNSRFISLIRNAIENSWFTILVNGEPAGSKKKILFEPLLDKIRAKVIGWEHNFLSHGGKLQLIKSVLSSMPIFLLQTLKEVHWTKWYNICFPIDEGGLGVRNLRDVIKAFSHKLWWRFRLNNSLWSNFTINRYCKKNHPYIAKATKEDSSIWRRLASTRAEAQKLIFWSLGTGKYPSGMIGGYPKVSPPILCNLTLSLQQK